jgi:Flp pilus assembly protein TadD
VGYRHVVQLAGLTLLAGSMLPVGWGADTHVIKIPRHSELTPVQRLNRRGVEAIKKHDYKNAESLFYKAYLYDPADPFTLNNLGYVSELEGDLDRAQKFYGLAAEQGSNATIDFSSAKNLQGKPMRDAVVNLQDATMRVNRMNINAMRLLAQNRGFEALDLLKKTLALDPKNVFTLNNLGVASEAVGDSNGALRYYLIAASSRSAEPTIVAADRAWRGKSVSDMAAASAKRLEKRIRDTGSAASQAIMLTIRGVFEANHDDWNAARQDFVKAYSLDPNSAFTLNNRGFVAEQEGDLETAQYFYSKAQRAENADASIGLATQLAAEGQSLEAVAGTSNGKVDDALEVYSRKRRQEQAPVELTPRGAAVEPSKPAAPQAQPQLETRPQL